jgi:hypothetical protein
MKERLLIRRYKKKNREPVKEKPRPARRSFLEDRFESLAAEANLDVDYEPERFPYVIRSHYLPDWRIAPNVFVETKGYFSAKNRSDLLSFREQYPEVKILLMFERAGNKLNKASNTTYAAWAEKYGFEWADVRDGIPRKWIALAKKLTNKNNNGKQRKNDSSKASTD